MGIGRLTKALRTRDRAGVERETVTGMRAFEAELTANLPKAVFNTLVAGGNATASTFKGKRAVTVSRAVRRNPTIRFDRTNQSAVAWAERHAAELVTDITKETRIALRNIVTRAFIEQMPPRMAARQIVRTIGLTERGEEAVANLRATLMSSPGKRVMAGKIAIRVPAKGIGRAQLDRALTAYAERLTKQRALLIARTETIAASNEGQRQLWQQAVQNGQLPRSAERVWIATGDKRTCPICSRLDGEMAPLNGLFAGAYDGPPAHPGCRCSQGIA